MEKEKHFIVLITGINKEQLSSSAVLFSSFNEAWAYAKTDAALYKHLANEYEELRGTKNLHARITMKGKHIHKMYHVHDLGTDPERNILDTHLNTYSSYDYLQNGIMI